MRDMHRTFSQLLQTVPCLVHKTGARLQMVCSTNHSSGIRCLPSIENVFKSSKSSSFLCNYFRGAHIFLSLVEMNDKSSIEKTFLTTMSNNHNIHGPMLDSRGALKLELTNSCSEKDVEILVLGRSLTCTKISGICSRHNFAESTFRMNEGDRESSEVFYCHEGH